MPPKKSAPKSEAQASKEIDDATFKRVVITLLSRISDKLDGLQGIEEGVISLTSAIEEYALEDSGPKKLFRM
jgi:hypothetical protein